ncbi:linker for activation of T-cells family member 2 isoform X2 [Pongo pygmaeus]|uniref:linker for activation of T-cells family member 2 isoform X2 n=1 Tax=Pongo pygmaeus TaxID=9600 RepID=UPI0023E0FDA5|nr:linker for activation of T-cells family member 2 isoform X2 [Pongo pygmaeus]
MCFAEAWSSRRGSKAGTRHRPRSQSASQEAIPGANMSSGTELLWPGAALLVLLGVAASLCVRCSRPGAKRSEKIYQQRSLREDQQSFTGSRTYSLVGQAWPGPLADVAPTRKDKLLQFSPSLEGPASSRYQNFSKGSRHGSEEAYIDPIAMEYYNWGRFSKPPEDDDTNSYENVLICKQKTTQTGAQQEGIGGLCRGDHSLSLALKTGPTSGLCPSASPEEDEESEDYQNSASIHQWRESRKVMGQLQREAPPGPVGSPDEEEDGEPDYVNGEVAATEA